MSGWGGKRAGAGGVGPKNPNPRRGEEAHFAKLTADDVRLIRATYESGGITQKELAEKFGVCQGSIQKAISFETWRHVP